jgi:hypothetical protein
MCADVLRRIRNARPTPNAAMLWSMKLGDATAVATDPRAEAFSYAQRRTWVFFAWWYGMVIAIPGAVDAALSGLLGQETDRGIFMMILGAAISVVGWLVTLGVRFSRKPPKPASDIPPRRASPPHQSPRHQSLGDRFCADRGRLDPVHARRQVPGVASHHRLDRCSPDEHHRRYGLFGASPEEQQRALRAVARTPPNTEHLSTQATVDCP